MAKTEEKSTKKVEKKVEVTLAPDPKPEPKAPVSKVPAKRFNPKSGCMEHFNEEKQEWVVGLR